MSESIVNNFKLLTSVGSSVDSSEWWFQYVDFMEALEKVDINIKLAIISLLPKDIDIFLQGKIFDFLIDQFKKSNNLQDKFSVMKFLMKFSTEMMYTYLWIAVRNDCAVSGDWSTYDRMSKVTLQQNRKLFNKCVGC